MKALIIDDDAATRLVLMNLLLRFFPRNVLQAGDGEAGWRIAERERPAVIFCDMYMPKLDGLGFLRRLRADPDLKDTPFVAITSAQHPEVVQQLIQLGVADYILKPIPMAATVARLSKLLPVLLASAKERELSPTAQAAESDPEAASADSTPTA